MDNMRGDWQRINCSNKKAQHPCWANADSYVADLLG